jgi:hypothetical protein
MIVEFVKNGHQFPHLVETVIAGPFNDVPPGPMKIA